MNAYYTEMRKKHSNQILYRRWEHLDTKYALDSNSGANSILYKGVLSLPNRAKQSFAQLIIYPDGSKYANVIYEDIVTKNQLSEITGYSVELNK